MEVIDAAIQQIAALEHQKQERTYTIRFLKEGKRQFFMQIGNLALIPQTRLPSLPIMNAGCSILLPMEAQEIIQQLEEQIHQLDEEIKRLHFVYFPEGLLGPEQLRDIRQQIRTQAQGSVPGYALRIDKGGIMVQESRGVQVKSNQRRISKFAVSHGIQ